MKKIFILLMCIVTLPFIYNVDADATNDRDDLDQDARLLGIHLHYISDKLGEPV